MTSLERFCSVASRQRTYLILMALVMIIQQGMTVGSNKDDEEVQHHLRQRHERQSKKFAGLYTGPYFDPAMPTNVSAQLGDTALLACKVNQIGGKTVSWIRKRDSHILTVDETTFISDDRFYILKPEKKHVWTLRIRYVQLRDAGLYECQVSTEPKMSYFVHLNVVEPRVSIEGNGNVHAHQGSNVVFKCLIQGTLQKPAYVFWYHGSRRLLPDYDSSMSANVTTVVEGKPPTSSEYMASGDDALSVYEATLKLVNVGPEQSGNYTCGPSNTKSATAKLHITDGEIRAAMSDGTNCGTVICANLLRCILVVWTVANVVVQKVVI